LIAVFLDTLEMKKFSFTFFMTFLLTNAFGQFKPEGIYVGLEKMKSYSSSEIPNHVWYHLSVLIFKDDSVFLEQSPVAIYKDDTIFSASDGGFYSYAGTIETYRGKTIADLTLKSCDYCPQQVIRFTPPKIVKDEDTTQVSTIDTATSKEPLSIKNPLMEHKYLILEKTKSIDTLLVDRNIYRRQKGK